MTTVMWFRDDLRLSDNPALLHASHDPDGVVCLYLLDERSPETRALGGAAKWWLHESLTALNERLEESGVTLLLVRGTARSVIPAVIRQTGATQVVWNRRYGAEKAIDAELKADLRRAGATVQSFAANLLHEPWTVCTKNGGVYRVYTPFWRACGELPVRAPLPEPAELRPASIDGAVCTVTDGHETTTSATATPEAFGETLSDWHLQPTAPDWAIGIARRWIPGERQARRRLDDFLHAGIDDGIDLYEAHRDEPAVDAVSGLSPYLRWGEISPHTVWACALASGRSVGGFLSELGWREFAWHTYFHHPDLATVNLDHRFDAFPWREDADAPEVLAWQQGHTGVPLVDAGMAELWQTGVMHNRVRMVAASFLVKNLLVDWRVGERWFWDTLVDADAASNPFNWQWVAGCGADAAPYFRIFNPVTQQRRFDPNRAYVDRWCAEKSVSDPLVDLRESRAHALAAFARISGR